MTDKTFRHPNQGKIVRTISRPDVTTISALAKCPTASIADVIGKFGVMAHEIKALDSSMKVCGSAITCLGPDLTVRRMAIDLAEPGDVLILAVEGVEDRACFGAYTAEKMKRKGIAGVVIDGATRDAAQIQEMMFPTFVRSITPRNFHYPFAPDYGAVNVDVCCGGTIVHPGDIVVGDADGVIVVPREIAAELAPKVITAMRAEEEKWKNRMDKPFNVEEELKSRGYRFE